MTEALEITQLITNIIIIILFLGLVIMVFGLIKHAKKLTEKIEGFSKDFSDVKPKVLDTVDRINFLHDNVNKAVTKVNENIDILGTVVEKVREMAESVIEFEKKIQSAIEPPVLDTLNTVTAVSVGVKTFFDSLKRNKSKNVPEPKLDDKIENIEDSIEDVTKELEEVNARLTDLQK